MRFTQETDYALRLVLAFSRLDAEEFLTAKEMSESQKIPYRFLLRVMKKLKAAGIIASRQGVDGGYRLARPRREISLHDVIEAVEGRVSLTHCLKDAALCNAGHAPECRVHRALFIVQEKLLRELKVMNFDNI